MLPGTRSRRMSGKPLIDERTLRRPNEAGRSPLASDFRFLELGGHDCPVERPAQLLGRVQRQLNAGSRAGLEASIDEVESDDVAQWRMTRVVIGNHRMRKRKPLVAALRHTLCGGDLD